MERANAKRGGDQEAADSKPGRGGRNPDLGAGPSSHGRTSKLVGRATAARERRRELGLGEFRGPRRGGAAGEEAQEKMAFKGGGAFKTPEAVVFEGRRASEKDGKPAGFVKTKGKNKGGRAARKGGPASKSGGHAGGMKPRGARRAAEWRKGKDSGGA